MKTKTVQVFERFFFISISNPLYIYNSGVNLPRSWYRYRLACVCGHHGASHFPYVSDHRSQYFPIWFVGNKRREGESMAIRRFAIGNKRREEKSYSLFHYAVLTNNLAEVELTPLKKVYRLVLSTVK